MQLETQGPTNTDPGADRWPITDDVIRVRQWGEERSQPLPTLITEDSLEELVVGSGAEAWMRLQDEHGRLSRRHAMIARKEGRWMLRDAGSKNGVLVDGVRRDEVVLEPGLEIWLGGVTLVAESGRLVALRTYLSRLLGWTSDRVRVVDLALRSIRTASMHQAALVLCGDDDLVQLARGIHRRLLGEERPFVRCDPRLLPAEDSARSPGNFQRGMEALSAAKYGSLCIWNNRLPRDFAEVKVALQDPDTRVQLIVCARHAYEAEAFGSTPIAIPSLTRRPLEIQRVVEEYGRDAELELGLPSTSFLREDRDWIVENASSSLAEVEKATLRLLAIREERGNLKRAAARLGMARPPLTKWINRRNLPVRVDDGDG